MLHLIAIVKPFRVEAVLEALAPIAAAPTVQEVRGYGRQKGHIDAYGGDEFGLDFIPKARIECDIEDLFFDEVKKQWALAETIQDRLITDLGIQVHVKLVEEKTLERIDSKGKMVIDNRKILP